MSAHNSSTKRTHIGVVGGGQLGAMLASAVLKAGHQITVLDPTPDCPAATVGARQIEAGFFDSENIRTLVEQVDVTTVELENIDTETLNTLAQKGAPVIPQPSVVAAIANKLEQKQRYADHGLPTSRFEPMPNPSAEGIRAFGLPAVQKAERGGYDGRGVALIKTESDLDDLLPGPSFVEAFVPHQMELGVMVAITPDGESDTWPVAEMHFNPQGNLLDYLVAPARIPADVAERAQELAVSAVKAMGGIGIYGVEMFWSDDGELLLNEMAPRTHNSGHYTMDACETSQFEQQMRILLGLSLGPTTLNSKAAMVNLLGAQGFEGATVVEGADQFDDNPNVHVHMYGKHDCRFLRKMGHLTALGETVDEALERAQRAAESIVIRGANPV